MSSEGNLLHFGVIIIIIIIIIIISPLESVNQLFKYSVLFGSFTYILIITLSNLKFVFYFIVVGYPALD
jgi:hypothetical protein